MMLQDNNVFHLGGVTVLHFRSQKKQVWHL